MLCTWRRSCELFGRPQEPPELTGAGAGATCWAGATCEGSWLGTDCGACPGACNPSELGLASGGNGWSAADPDAAGLVAAAVGLGVFAASERPGVSAEASAASAAVNPAAPMINHLLVRATRKMAASRCTRACVRSWDPVSCSPLIAASMGKQAKREMRMPR